MKTATATLPQEDWDLIFYLLQKHSDGVRRQLDEGIPSSPYNELLANAAAETDDIHFRLQQQVSND